MSAFSLKSVTYLFRWPKRYFFTIQKYLQSWTKGLWVSQYFWNEFSETLLSQHSRDLKILQRLTISVSLEKETKKGVDYNSPLSAENKSQLDKKWKYNTLSKNGIRDGLPMTK